MAVESSPQGAGRELHRYEYDTARSFYADVETLTTVCLCVNRALRWPEQVISLATEIGEQIKRPVERPS
eukprot:5841623-Prymnesium_polylepis.1